MQIRLISYSENKLVLMNRTHEIIVESIREAISADTSFSYFTTQKDLFGGIQNAIESANVILLAVDVSKFISTKAALFRALGFKCKLNAEITDLISSDKCMATLNEKQTNAHAAIPLGAEAFITYDGLFSGIGIKAGPQKLILVPIDEKRIKTIIDNGMISFALAGFEKAEGIVEEVPKEIDDESAEEILEEVPEEIADETAEEAVEDTEEIADEISEEITEETAEEKAEEVSEEIEETAEDINPDYVEIYSAPQVPEADLLVETPQPDYENIESSSLVAEDAKKPSDDYIQKTYIQSKVEDITARGFKISVVRQPENNLCGDIFEELETIPGVKFVDFPIDPTLEDDAKRKENIASNARMAMAQTQAAFSIAVSEIYYTQENEAYIFATLTDSQKSSVYKVFAAPEDGAAELYREGVVNIIEKIEETVKTTDFVSVSTVEPYNEDQQKKQDGKKKMPSSTLILMWVLIIVAIAALTVLVLDVVLSESASLMASSHEIISQANNFLLR